MVAIAETEKKDDGWYQCTAVNPVGSATTRARLQVVMPKEIPSAPIMPQLRIPYPGRTIVPEYDILFSKFFFFIFFPGLSLILPDLNLMLDLTNDPSYGQENLTTIC